MARDVEYRKPPTPLCMRFKICLDKDLYGFFAGVHSHSDRCVAKIMSMSYTTGRLYTITGRGQASDTSDVALVRSISAGDKHAMQTLLSRLFRRLFLKLLAMAHEDGRLAFFGEHVLLADTKAFGAFLAPLRKAEWVVYAKEPFGGPQAVLAYLSRYTHRVAISNRRLIAAGESGVTFKWKDYRRLLDSSAYNSVLLRKPSFSKQIDSPWR
jgi:Putative transposase